MTSKEWKITDMIKKGMITYQLDDKVVIFRRKSNGYPGGIKNDIDYTIKRVEGDAIYVAIHSSDGVGWLQPIKVHRTYMIPKYALREVNLNSLLS
jgi:hypothetical protein